MRLKRLVGAPRSRLWWPGALVVGLVLPLALTVLFHLGGYFPPSRLFPGSLLWSAITLVLILCLIGLGVLATGMVWSLLSWNWRPIALAVLFAATGYMAMWPAEYISTAVRMSGLERMADRSVVLVEAIEAFARDHGAPPDTLEALVPTYLPAVPSTGMAAAPTYNYSTKNVPCSGENSWSIWVVPAAFETFLYCPKRDYGEPAWDRRPIGTWLLTKW